MLKLPYTGEGPTHEADALALWAGDGGVRLLERDKETDALLLEHVRPGTPLLEIADPEEALAVACGLLRRIWHPAPGQPFASVHAHASGWAAESERRFDEQAQPFDVALLRAACSAFEQLAAYGGESVVLHQDFHRGNVLRAEREPWLAIDPKPLAGERAFDAHWLLRDLTHSEPRSPLPPGRLVERLAAELSLEVERIRLWALARSVQNALWCYESGEDAGIDLALVAALA